MPRSNNFDVLRLAFASMVVLFHCYDLSLEPALNWVPHICSAQLAVEGFFAMSGCLIVSSYENSSSLGSYLEKRARRIVPAYWLALLFTLLIGVTFSTLPPSAFLRSSDTWKYTLANLGFLNFIHPNLPGLFTQNQAMDAVNGSLWTLKVEVMFYLFVPVLVWLCRRFGRWQTLTAVCLFSLAFRYACERLHHDRLLLQLPAQLGFFAIGAFVYYYYPKLVNHRRWVWTVAALGYAAYIASGSMVFRVIGVSLLVMCAGLFLPALKRRPGAGDYSYGVYVLHFPVIQVVVSLGLFHAHPLLSLLLVGMIVSVLSYASWNLVEKRYLRASRRAQLSSAVAASV